MTQTLNFKRLLVRNKLFLSNSPYAFKRSRSDGEDDLRRLVDKAKQEGAWVFREDQPEWFNIGYEVFETESTDDVRGMLGVNTYSFDIGQLGKAVSHYHIHPRSQERKMFDFILGIFKDGFGREKYESTNREKQDRIEKFFRNHAAARVSVPSTLDGNVKGDVDSWVNALRETNNCILDFKIVTPHGIVTTNFLQDKPDVNVAQKYAQIHRQLQLERAIRLYSDTNEESAISRTIDEINSHMDGEMSLTFSYN